MKKLLLLLATALLLTGCGSNALKENYDNMKIGKDGINGYMLDLRVYGNQGKERVNDILRITAFGDNYQVINVNTDVVKEEAVSTPTSIEREITYIKGDKVYTADKTGTYVVNKKTVAYTHPQLVLDGLKNITKIDKGTKTKVGDTNYTLYKVTFKKAAVSKILDDTTMAGTKVTKDVEGEVYIDSKGYVYRIIYNLEDVTINASYFSINTVREISFPNEIK